MVAQSPDLPVDNIPPEKGMMRMVEGEHHGGSKDDILAEVVVVAKEEEVNKMEMEEMDSSTTSAISDPPPPYAYEECCDKENEQCLHSNQNHQVLQAHEVLVEMLEESPWSAEVPYEMPEVILGVFICSPFSRRH